MITKNLKKFICALVFITIFFIPKSVFAESMPSSIINYINNNSIDKSYIIGDKTNISDAVQNFFPNSYRMGNAYLGNDPYGRNYSLNNNYTSEFTDKNGKSVYTLSHLLINHDKIYIASGENFPDALSGSALAAKTNSPVYIIPKNESYSNMSELINGLNFENNDINFTGNQNKGVTRELTKDIIILGGTSSISLNYENMLKNQCTFKPSITRIYGQDRYETAANISKNGWDSSDYVILVNGENYPDALSSSILAKKYNAPVLLTNKDSLNGSTKAEIQRLKANNIYIIGGTGVINTTVENQLKSMGISTERIGGQDRYETSVKVAEKFNEKTNGVFVINGYDFQDGISVAPLAASNSMPIILVPSDVANTNTSQVPVSPTIPTNTGYDTSKTGNIKGVVTWQYNDFIGTKADVGAKIGLIPKNLNKNSDNKVFTLTMTQTSNGTNGIYTGKADGYGNYEIDDIPAGEYYLLIVSNNTNSDMTIDSWTSSVLGNLFSEKDWEYLQNTLKLNKYEFKKIQITPNKTIIESHDFGNTYF